MDRDYLQEALQTFNGTNGVNWYGWKKYNEDGTKIPNNQRMCYECIEIIKDGATMPTKVEVDTKITEIKQQEKDVMDRKLSGKQKLIALGLTQEEVKALLENE